MVVSWWIVAFLYCATSAIYRTGNNSLKYHKYLINPLIPNTEKYSLVCSLDVAMKKKLIQAG